MPHKLLKKPIKNSSERNCYSLKNNSFIYSLLTILLNILLTRIKYLYLHL